MKLEEMTYLLQDARKIDYSRLQGDEMRNLMTDIVRNKKVIYGWTAMCSFGDDYQSACVLGDKGETHQDQVDKAPIICGRPLSYLLRYSNIKSWRYEPVVKIMSWWEKPSKAEKESAEDVLKKEFGINPDEVGHTDMNSFKNPMPYTISHGMGTGSNFYQYMRNLGTDAEV